MLLPKTKPVRSQKLRDSARGKPCVRCGVSDGTVVLAHYTGVRQHAYGKGRGIKCHDCLGAELCRSCHLHFDAPEQRKSIEASEEFHHLIALTWLRWVESGLVTIRGA